VPARRRNPNPVLQLYQVEIRGNQYYVLNVQTRAISGGPFKTREEAQKRADELEKRSPRRGY
jgi:hypothetical protein